MTTAAGSGANSYVYNADGKRVRRVVGAQTFFQIYGLGGELVAETSWNGSTATLQKEYGYRDGEMLIVAESATVRSPGDTNVWTRPGLDENDRRALLTTEGNPDLIY